MPTLSVRHRQPIAAFWYTTLGPILIALVIFYVGTAVATSAALDGAGAPHLGSAVLVITLALSIVAVSYPILHYLMFTYEITDNTITVRSGIIFRQHETINFSRIQSIENERGPILMLFGLTFMEIWTASPNQHASSPAARAYPDTALYLKKHAAEELKCHILQRPIPGTL